MRRFFLLFVVLFSLGVLVGSVSAMTSSDPFPVHASMRPNVEFWKKIYSEYPSTQGVLHDINNLNIIYEVVELEPHGPGSSRVNSERIKKAKDRYLTLLDKFARGEAPATQFESRIYAMFGPNPKRQDFCQARDGMRCQTGQKDRFLAGVKRSGKYLERIKDIFRSQGLPEDLAYLPHVESSYNYEAYSKFGAAGIWQFTRSTGQRFMQVDYVVDERRDPIAASYAAARFLKENHELLGSWPLALTAYNHGPNGMLRAKKEKGSYARIFDEYDGDRFKFASRNFYSEYIAACHVAKNYKHYFGNVNVDQPVLYHTIEMEGYAPLATICNFFHIGKDEVKKVNPALRPPVFDGQKHIPKGYRLRLPGHSQKMARMSLALPSSLFERGQKRSNFYRVQRGDTAGKIAKRHNVSINELAAANGLSRRATIYVGQNLRIPAGEEKSTMLASATSNSKRSPAVPTMAILKEKVLAKATAQEKSSSPVVGSLAKWRPRGNPHGLIAAREEETPLPSLVARAEKKVVEPLEIPVPAASEEEVAVPDEMPAFAQAEMVAVDMSEIEPPMVVAEVAQQPLSVLEGLVEFVLPAQEVDAELLSELAEESPENSVLAENEVLAMASDAVAEEEPVGGELEVAEAVEGFETIEAAEVVNPLVLVGNFDVSKMKTVKGTATGTIRVEVEETLGHYADWLEIPTQNIRRLNSYRYGKPIQYGQKLKLPFAKVSKEDFEERRYLYHKEMVEDFFVAYKIEGDKTYRVKKGDNLWTLCHDDFDLPFWLIKQYNSNFDFHALRLGSEIKVPLVSKIDSDSQIAEVNPGSLPEKPLAKRISAKKLATQ
jgi:membrane-bound lytic murein transglycosylase D